MGFLAAILACIGIKAHEVCKYNSPEFKKKVAEVHAFHEKINKQMDEIYGRNKNE